MDELFTTENIEEMLDTAMKQENIIVYYQPKYDAITSKINGSEALARWMHQGEIISPAKFIPLLEETKLITRLDWYVLERVCRLLKKQIAEEMHPVKIAVNFSRQHTYETDFSNRLVSIVDKYNIPHKYIEVEITESTIEKNRDTIIAFTGDIKAQGFSIAIDDFGSGLSSLNFIKDIPANVLKIDKSLLSGNCENEKERIVLESIFNFAHRLQLKTVAEGVETKEQLGFLRTCGCKTIQGFYFSKPITDTEYCELCKNRKMEQETDDILTTQPASTATQLLLDAVFTCYPLVIMSNLTRNSFYMMAYDNFTTQSCPSTGVYSELIVHGAATMHPDDQKLFADTFDIADQLAAFAGGERTRRVVTRQLGDDNIYRAVETTNYYMQNPAVDDVLAITLSRPLE